MLAIQMPWVQVLPSTAKYNLRVSFQKDVSRAGEMTLHLRELAALTGFGLPAPIQGFRRIWRPLLASICTASTFTYLCTGTQTLHTLKQIFKRKTMFHSPHRACGGVQESERSKKEINTVTIFNQNICLC